MEMPEESSAPPLERFLAASPKGELHLHLRGAMPSRVFADLLRKYPGPQALQNAPQRHLDLFRQFDNIRPFLSPDAGLSGRASDLFHFQTFQQFLATYLFTSYFIREISDFRTLIQEVCRDLASQQIVYAEITVSVVEYVSQGIPLPEIIEALDESANAEDVRVQWIVDLVRDIGPQAALSLLQEILTARPRSIVGITLGGSEHQAPPGGFQEAYRLARDAGLRLSVHAGEAMGPESVWEAIRLLGVERIGHGVRAIEDERLVAYLAEHRIPLEICPTSNVRTGIYPSYEAHPVRDFYAAGVPVTINTDDPAFFGVSLAGEYLQLHRLGLGDEDILTIMKNAFRYSFLPQEDARLYIAELDSRWRKFQSEG